MGFTNIYVNHIDIKLVFTDGLSFYSFHLIFSTEPTSDLKFT